MTPLDAAGLTAIEERLKKATPVAEWGPVVPYVFQTSDCGAEWKSYDFGPGETMGEDRSEADADLCAHAPSDLAALLATVQAQQREIDLLAGSDKTAEELFVKLEQAEARVATLTRERNEWREAAQSSVGEAERAEWQEEREVCIARAEQAEAQVASLTRARDDAYSRGWLAGRDAAAEKAEAEDAKWGDTGDMIGMGHLIAVNIRALPPPASEGHREGGQ